MAEATPAGGLSVELLAMPAGVVELRPMTDHLLSIHVGAPVRVACRADGRSFRRLQQPGDIDVLPAGLTGIWEDETAATVLLLRLSPSLLSRAAEAMELDPARAVPRRNSTRAMGPSSISAGRSRPSARRAIPADGFISRASDWRSARSCCVARSASAPSRRPGTACRRAA